MARVKICGLTRGADVRAAADAGADAVGVVCDVPVDTPREVDVSKAATLLADAPPFVTTVLVTMPETPRRAVELAGAISPDVLQLHGEFGVEELSYIRAETETAVVIAVDIEREDRALQYDEVADAVLVDSTTDEGAGGTGETHDWAATRDLASRLRSPVVLAGGLTPANVAEAVDVVDPYAVDVATGVEVTGGVKDHDAVRSFVRRAREDRRERNASDQEVSA